MYRVLRTIDDNGQMLTDAPTVDRIVGDGYTSYADALTAAVALRTSAYQHKGTGEVRTFSELDTTGAAYREDDDGSTWRFVQAATLIGHRGYALAVHDDDLSLYEPKAS